MFATDMQIEIHSDFSAYKIDKNAKHLSLYEFYFEY